jgi:hypothetical protein
MATDLTMHPAAPAHLPGFITAPGETDPLFVGSVVFLIVLLMALGSLYFWLHSLPERIAHGTGRIQFQLVGVLALLALFTHNNLFWVMALFLALIPIPDFWTPLSSMADSLASMVRTRRRDPLPEEPIDLTAQPMLPLEQGVVADAANGTPADTEGHRP